jgi:alkylation response protein AidB-like acyl-CoA dehydrogenase
MSPAATALYAAVTYADGEGVERYAYAMVPTGAPGVVVHDDWYALGMRASGSNSISREGVELPESGVRGGFRAGDPVPYMGAQPGGRAGSSLGGSRTCAPRPSTTRWSSSPAHSAPAQASRPTRGAA